MDHQWIYNMDQRLKEYIKCIHYCLKRAKRHKKIGFMCYPYRDCKNEREYYNFGPNMEKQGF
jgi:hypothetical protein